MWAMLTAILLTGAALGVSEAQQAVEPAAGTWRTWVIGSGQELRRTPPPDRAASDAEIKTLEGLATQRDPAALDLIGYWDTGGPSYRWNEIAITDLLRTNANSIAAARHLGLLHVAIYDAMVAAWETKYVYKRPRPSELSPGLATVLPNPRSPSYPAEHAVAAGAASAVLAYIFPERASVYTARAEEAGRSRLLAGVQYPSDVTAGLALGREVAARVIERAKTDGFDVKWSGTVPTEPGKWSGTNPVMPHAATWKPWVLSSPSEFRPGPPFAHDSPQIAAEMDELRRFQRTPKHIADAFFWEYAVGGPRNYQFWNDQISRKVLEYRLDGNPPRAARAYAIVSVAFYDSTVACWDAKYTYWAIRPFQLDPNFKPIFTTPNHPSYPAAHGCLSTSAATALSYLFPRDAAALDALAADAAESRVWAGIHYRSDVVAGRALGRSVAQKVIERARTDGAQ